MCSGVSIIRQPLSLVLSVILPPPYGAFFTVFLLRSSTRPFFSFFVASMKKTTVSAYDVRIRRMKHNLACDANKILQHAGNWPCVEGSKMKGGGCDKFGLCGTTLISSWMEPKPSVHSCAHRSLRKWSCHLTARHWRTTLCGYPCHVVDPLGFFAKKNWLGRYFHGYGNARRESDDVCVWQLIEKIDPPIRSNHLNLIVHGANAVSSFVMR